jgi:hypothetical protein
METPPTPEGALAVFLWGGRTCPTTALTLTWCSHRFGWDLQDYSVLPLSTFELGLNGAGAVAMGLSHPWGQWPSVITLQLRPLRCWATEQTDLRWPKSLGSLLCSTSLPRRTSARG